MALRNTHITHRDIQAHRWHVITPQACAAAGICITLRRLCMQLPQLLAPGMHLSSSSCHSSSGRCRHLQRQLHDCRPVCHRCGLLGVVQGRQQQRQQPEQGPVMREARQELQQQLHHCGCRRHSGDQHLHHLDHLVQSIHRGTAAAAAKQCKQRPRDDQESVQQLVAKGTP